MYFSWTPKTCFMFPWKLHRSRHVDVGRRASRRELAVDTSIDGVSRPWRRPAPLTNARSGPNAAYIYRRTVSVSRLALDTLPSGPHTWRGSQVAVDCPHPTRGKSPDRTQRVHRPHGSFDVPRPHRTGCERLVSPGRAAIRRDGRVALSTGPSHIVCHGWVAQAALDIMGLT